MHSKFICHRDIKLDNLIYNQDSRTVKIIDFGFAIGCRERIKVFWGTPSYMSPEIVLKKEYDGQAADVWAVGVVCYYLLTGQPPFTGGGLDKILFKNIAKGHFKVPEFVCSDATSFLRLLLNVDASKRLSAEEALKHHWFTSS